MLSLLNGKGRPPLPLFSLFTLSDPALILPGELDDRDHPDRQSLRSRVDGDCAAWPGEWETHEIDVFFYHDAFQSIGAVAGCDDWDLKDRLRHQEYVVAHEYPPNYVGRVLQNVLMCDPVTQIFFYVRMTKDWRKDGVPQILVYAIWPAVGKISVELRRAAARMALTETQFAQWLNEGEPTMRDLPRLHGWFSKWARNPEHPVLIDELCLRRDHVEVTLEDTDGDTLMVGFLPQALRKIRRDRLVTQDVFWAWIDERLKDLRTQGLLTGRPGMVDIPIEEVKTIRARNVRGLPKPDGTQSEPILQFVLWRRK
jgi:hypothetical protein